MNNEEKNNALKIRMEIFEVQDELNFISKLSWRLNQIDNKYDVYSNDADLLMDMQIELYSVRHSLIKEISSNTRLALLIAGGNEEGENE